MQCEFGIEPPEPVVLRNISTGEVVNEISASRSLIKAIEIKKGEAYWIYFKKNNFITDVFEGRVEERVSESHFLNISNITWI